MINSMFVLDLKPASSARESEPVQNSYPRGAKGEVKYSCLIVDKNRTSLETLRTFVEQSDSFELMEETENGKHVLALARRKSPDVLIINLDILQSSLEDLLVALRDDPHSPVIVLISSRSDFAAEAFTLDASDYLVTPLSFDRLEACFRRVREQLALRRMPTPVQGQEPWKESAFKDELLLRTRGRILFVHPSDIKYIRAERNYIRFHLRSETVLIRGAMSRLLSSLDPRLFCRIHRSTIVNVRFIKELRPWAGTGAGNVLLKDGTTLRTGRTYMWNMLKAVDPR